MTKVILIIGRQGSGKTWVMKKLIDLWDCKFRGKIGLVYFHYKLMGKGKRMVITGKYDNTTFEGSDRLSMAVMKDYNSFLEYFKDSIILLEGDRFTNFNIINHPSHKPFIIKITDDGSKGRAIRGSNQSESALKRMATRVANIDADVNVKDSKEALEMVEQLINKYYEQ